MLLVKKLNFIKKSTEIKPKVNELQNVIIGGVIYVDNYGNIITNISEKTFKNIGKGRNFVIKARRYTFKKVYNRYNEIVDYTIPVEKRQYDGEKLAIFNSAGFLEIAIYRSNLKTVGGASTLLGLGYRDTVSIEFETITKQEFTPIN